MGSTAYAGRERREREMYLIVFLLISPAFGRPGSAQLDVGHVRVIRDISNPFNYIHNSTALKEAEKKSS